MKERTCPVCRMPVKRRYLPRAQGQRLRRARVCYNHGKPMRVLRPIVRTVRKGE